MSLQEKIYKDLHSKDISKKKKDTLRFIVGELQRQPTKELSDDQVIKILKKLAESEKEMGEKKDSEYIEILQSYLPQEAYEEEIVNWIEKNIDFSGYKNKMQAMKDIMAHFGSRADGNKVKEILSTKF